MQTELTSTKKKDNPAFKGGNANMNGRPKGTPNRTTRVLKDAILYAAGVAGGTREKPDLEQFLINEARKKDNRPFMALLGRVLPLTIVGDKNRPLEVLTRVELVAATGAVAPRDVTPPARRVAPPVIDGKVTVTRPAPPPPVKVKAPVRSGT